MEALLHVWIPMWLSGEESSHQCKRYRRCWFDPRVRKITWRKNTAHSSILARRIPWAEEPGELHPWGCKESDMTEFLSTQEPHTLHKNKKVHKRWVNLNIIPWLPQRHRCLKSRVGTKKTVWLNQVWVLKKVSTQERRKVGREESCF